MANYEIFAEDGEGCLIKEAVDNPVSEMSYEGSFQEQKAPTEPEVTALFEKLDTQEAIPRESRTPKQVEEDSRNYRINFLEIAIAECERDMTNPEKSRGYKELKRRLTLLQPKQSAPEKSSIENLASTQREYSPQAQSMQTTTRESNQNTFGLRLVKFLRRLKNSSHPLLVQTLIDEGLTRDEIKRVLSHWGEKAYTKIKEKYSDAVADYPDFFSCAPLAPNEFMDSHKREMGVMHRGWYNAYLFFKKFGRTPRTREEAIQKIISFGVPDKELAAFVLEELVKDRPIHYAKNLHDLGNGSLCLKKVKNMQGEERYIMYMES
jgi:hypothetical protein